MTILYVRTSIRKKISFYVHDVKSEPSKTSQLNTSSLMDVFIFLRLSQRAAPASSTLSFSIVFQLKLSTDDFFLLSMLFSRTFECTQSSPAKALHTQKTRECAAPIEISRVLAHGVHTSLQRPMHTQIHRPRRGYKILFLV